MTLLELFGLFSILTPLTVVIFKLYWDSVKDESSRLRKANEVLSIAYAEQLYFERNNSIC